MRRPLIALACSACWIPSACASVRGGPVPDTVWAFTAPWRPTSYASAVAHADQLDGIVSGWIQLDSTSGRPVTALFPDTLRRAGSATRYMGLVTSYVGDRFHPETVRLLASDTATLGRTAAAIADVAARGGYGGLVIDFEGQARDDLPGLLAVVRAIADSARRRGVSPTAMAIPAGDTVAYPAAPLLGAVDYALVMLYDQHWANSLPGPIAEPAWLRRALAVRVTEVGAGRLIAGLPLYGYEWRPGSTTADVISYADAQRLAAAAGTTLGRDASSNTLRASRPGQWELWVSDAELVRSLLREVAGAGVRRIALWALGWEDPDVWKVIRTR